MYKIFMTFSILLTACVSSDVNRSPDAISDKKLLESRDGVQRNKYFAKQRLSSGESGIESSEKQADSADAVAVYLPGQKTKYVQKPSRTYTIKSKSDAAELNALLIYVDSYKPNLGVAINANLKMGAQSVQKRGDRTFVKFEQYVEREVSGKKYKIPVVGSNVVVALKNNQVISILSGITNPPDMGIVLQNPGFDLTRVSGVELELIRSLMQEYGKTDEVSKYLANVAANTGQKFDLASWLKDNPSVQLQRIKEFFSGIKKISTAKILIDMARMNRLGFIKRNGKWHLQATKVFGLPVEFDLEIPTTTEQKLTVKNIRDLRRDITIEVHSSPSFPAFGPVVSRDKEVPTGVATDNVTKLFQGILGYFREKHNWVGPSGDSEGFKVQIHKGIAEGNYVENAFWMGGSFQLFGIGAGGPQLTNFDSSPSVMGHEFGHAIVEFTSGLVYQGQSGALNEHIADVQGVMVEAHLASSPYSFVVGSDIVTPEAAAPRQKVVDLILASNKVSAEEIGRFNLKKMGLRNMYQPSVSLFAQPSTVEQGESMGFGSSCEPSENNDHCGVHYLSGIPNRATSLLIGEYGEDRVRQLFFNTATQRLGSASDFSEYLRQMHEECLASPELGNEVCASVIAAFQNVGVEFPDGDTTPPPPPIPDTTDKPAPDPKKPESPPLKLCGWISISATNNITVIDNKYDTVILNEANSNKFGGNFTKIEDSDFKLWKHKDCGCVTGTISQTPNSKNVWFNYFLEVKPGAVQKHKSTAGCKSIVFK